MIIKINKYHQLSRKSLHSITLLVCMGYHVACVPMTTSKSTDSTYHGMKREELPSEALYATNVGVALDLLDLHDLHQQLVRYLTQEQDLQEIRNI